MKAPFESMSHSPILASMLIGLVSINFVIMKFCGNVWGWIIGNPFDRMFYNSSILIFNRIDK